MELGNWLAEAIISENNIKNIIVIYPGRFQPMGRHHAAVYKKLASKFGKSNTYIATSDKVQLPKSPLNFKEKAQVMKQHGITNVVQVKNPYQSIEITSKYDPETTAVLFAVGKKDMAEDPRFRVGKKKNGDPSYFQYYEGNEGNLQSYTKHGYLIVAPHVDIQIPGFGEMSGTTLRQVLATADAKVFEDVMGFYDEMIHRMLQTKFGAALGERVEEFVRTHNLKDLLSEASLIGGSKADVDDGPRYFYGNRRSYEQGTRAVAERLGYHVVNYIMNPNQELTDNKTEFPAGPPEAVSFFPVGQAGVTNAGTNYTKNLRGNKAYRVWSEYIKKVAERVGYTFLNFLGAEEAVNDSKSTPSTPEPLVQESFSKEWWSLLLKETMIKEAKANTHLTHLEELILTQGAAGYKQARSFLIELLKNLKGSSDAKVNTTVKWDGAPAIFTGINPDNGQFFVGTKSVFNKVPKINYTNADIERNHGEAPGLADKLKRALKVLPTLGIQNILQGDFMFDDSTLKRKTINGVPHYIFKPNTITYAVEVDSDLGRQLEKAEFGIVFHTAYDSLSSGAQFGASVANLKKSPLVWFDDAFFKDTTGSVLLTSEEAKRVAALIKQADSLNVNYDRIPSAFLNTYINSEIRQGEFVQDPKKSFDNFKAWIQAKIDKKVDGLKSEAGKQKAIAAGEQQMSDIEAAKKDILNAFTVTKLLAEAKLVFVNKYNNAVYNTKHFKDDGRGGLVATAPEGFVAIDRFGQGVKLVDRLEFSRANFAMDKGFTK